MNAIDSAAPGFLARMAALLLRARELLGKFPMALIQLGARAALASIFFHSGLSKLQSWDTTILLFSQEYNVPLLPPETAAHLSLCIELGCPVLLILGLFTRAATLPMLGMTAIIEIFVYPENWTDHLTWATLLILLLTRGPGPLSLDHLWAPRVLGNAARV